jgi:[acyl-carrier-protein] S-malonyltransferase
MSNAVVFPGQGSQVVGMGRALADNFAEARHLFQEIDDALDQSLSRLMWEGPIDQLTLTENAQPALMAVSLAVMAVLRRQGAWRLVDHAAFVAGHSLGEYSALVAAESFTLGDAARLLKLRGRAMQKAVPIGQGAMAALLGVDIDEARAIAAEAAGTEICAVANDNSPGQVVISGHRDAVARAMVLAAERGFKRSVLLPVSAPFHCALMRPAAEAMQAALAIADLKAPVVPLIGNVTAQPCNIPETLRRQLVEQVTATVRWRESVQTMKELGVTRVIEAGAGKVLAGLVKRTDKEIEAVSLQTPEEIDAYLSRENA